MNTLDYSSGEENDFEMCSPKFLKSLDTLPFDTASLESIVYLIVDKFDFRILLDDSRTRNALLVTTGLGIAGSIIGKHYGGNMGAAIGGAFGGACGLGFIVVAIRDVWDEVKPKLIELLDLVYDYLSGLRLEDYKTAAKIITEDPQSWSELANILLALISSALNKKVFSDYLPDMITPE